MPLYDRGPLPTTPYNSSPAIPTDIFARAVAEWPNYTPLVSRLPKVPCGALSFNMLNDGLRPQSTTINNGGVLLIGGTSVVVTDASIFDVDDVVQLATGEFALITAINTTTNALTITRGYAGSTAAQQADASTVYLITNTRNGAAVDIEAMSRRVASSTQWIQNIQHAYSVGGQLIDASNYVGAHGDPLQGDRYRAAQEVFRDFERAMLYGKVRANDAAGAKPMMGGLRTVLTTNNIGPGQTVTAPTDASAYKPSSLIRDTIAKCNAAGGQPTHLLVSTDWLGAFSKWGAAAQTIAAGSTVIGTPIEMFAVSFIPMLRIIQDPMLRPGTVVCVCMNELRIQMQRPLYDKPRGSRGDAEEGDIIMRGAIEIDNESHHAWVEGITGFAAD